MTRAKRKGEWIEDEVFFPQAVDLDSIIADALSDSDFFSVVYA